MIGRMAVLWTVGLAMALAGCTTPTVYPCARTDVRKIADGDPLRGMALALGVMGGGQPPVVDGDLSDACWANAAKGEVSHPVGGGAPVDPAPASFRLLWDETWLYFAAEVRDDTPSCVGAARDDRVWERDCFELYLNPDNRKGEYYEIDFNSAGVVWDSLWVRRSDGRPQILRGWTAPSLECKTRTASQGWTLEGRVRLDEFAGSAHMPPQDGDAWRFNANYLDFAGKAQKMFTWSPVDLPTNTSRFGEVRFLNPAGTAVERYQRRTAAQLLWEATLDDADSLTEHMDAITVKSQSGMAFEPTAKGDGWALPGRFGRFTRRERTATPPRLTFRVQPADAGDPLVVDFKTWKGDGTALVVLARLDGAGARCVAEGAGDGAWVTVETAGFPVLRLHTTSQAWQAGVIGLPKGQAVRITVDSGPAGSLAGDFVSLAVYQCRDPGVPVSLGVDAAQLPKVADAGAVVCVKAGARFAEEVTWVPRAPGTKLYRVSGSMRTELSGTTKAHVGVDYCTSDRKFIRQACTRAPLNAHLRWGLYNVSGRTDWERFVGYAYDIPRDAAWLRVWCGVNAWETPDAAGSAWFKDLRVEAVEPDPATPLGFPPARWEPESRPAWSEAVRECGALLAHVPATRYVLPEQMPLQEEDSREAATFSAPGWKEPITFTLFAIRPLKNVRVKVGDFVTAGVEGRRIPAEMIDIRRVRYIWKHRHLTSNEYLLSPNHLESFETCDVDAGRNQQFWLTVRVPETALPGRYISEARVEADGMTAKTLRLTLDVLPVRTTAPTGSVFGLYSYYMKNDSKAKLLADYRDMADHGMTTTFMFNPWIAIPIEKDAAGRARIVWGEGNRLQDVFEAHRDAGFTTPLHLIAPDALFKAAEAHGGACGTEAFATAYRDLWTQIRAEQTGRGWPDFVVAPNDEGYPYPFAPERFRLTRILGGILRESRIPIALHALNHPTEPAVRFEKEFYPWADTILLTWCHPPVTVSEAYRGFPNWSAWRERARADGKKALFYNIDCTGVHPEAMRFGYGVGLWSRQADGIMDWHYNESQRDGGYGISRVQGSAVLNFSYAPAGEFRGGPAIGWEAAREGVKDYTLLHTLRVLTDKAAKSPDAAVRELGTRAAREVGEIVGRATFDTIDTTSALTLPARWERERWDESGARVLGGEFKIPNGLAPGDYDLLRRRACEHIMQLQDRVGR